MSSLSEGSREFLKTREHLHRDFPLAYIESRDVPRCVAGNCVVDRYDNAYREFTDAKEAWVCWAYYCLKRRVGGVVSARSLVGPVVCGGYREQSSCAR